MLFCARLFRVASLPCTARLTQRHSRAGCRVPQFYVPRFFLNVGTFRARHSLCHPRHSFTPKGYYQKGGSFLLTRYATCLPAYLGEPDRVPNNCWDGNEQSAEVVSEPWSFFATGHTDHPLFANLVTDGTDPTRIYTCDAGYGITNSTAQWHIGTDWGGYADYDAWRAATGAADIAYGGDKAIVAWEFTATDDHGAIICIGSGCYDWYSTSTTAEHYHQNVARMTQNAFDYLTK
ncbi:MAG: DUF4960 domain-containing protein [Paludibacteraceae bacterium]|nr:DUF4960 domain-containing protein [Paludibacteraceae bacterium]